MTLGDLVERDGLYYEKFTDAPFNGKVTGDKQGSFKNGKKDGAWFSYYRGNKSAWVQNHKNGIVWEYIE